MNFNGKGSKKIHRPKKNSQTEKKFTDTWNTIDRDIVDVSYALYTYRNIINNFNHSN